MISNRYTNKMSKPITIYEYDTLSESEIGLNNFEALKTNILEDNGSEEPKNVLSLIIKGRKQYVKANNYVGAICFRDGTIIEILPKVGKVVDNETVKKRSKEILEQMLSVSFDLPFKTYEDTSLERIDRNPFEFFIRSFIDRLDRILNEGLASMYFDVQGNETFLKGRINFSENIRHNYSHKERVFLEYQLFGANTPANRLIKTTVELLFVLSTDSKNRSDLNRLRSELDSIPRSVNIDKDFDLVIIDRNMGLYPDILKWCDIFLRNGSLSTFHGNEIAFSFLFPMERLYESFVAKLIFKKYYRDFIVTAQSGTMFLFDAPNRRFPMRPDVIMQSRKNPSKKYIVDTKWKLISNQNDISQSDVYQMFAYSKRYKTTRTILLYPGSERTGWDYEVEDVAIRASFIDLSRIDIINDKMFFLNLD